MTGLTECPDCGCRFYPTPQQSKRFVPPSVDEVRAYCEERRNGIDAARFVDHYTANGWVRGKTKVQDWRACVRYWERVNGDKGKDEGNLCPLCRTYRLQGNARVCSTCGAHCRKCGEGTANLKIVKYPNGALSAWCMRCFESAKK